MTFGNPPLLMFNHFIFKYRAEFLAALANIEAILIRAQFSGSMISTSLQYVTMDTAVDYRTGQPRAYEVEQCSCPSEYIGFSCEV